MGNFSPTNDPIKIKRAENSAREALSTKNFLDGIPKFKLLKKRN